MSQNSIQKRSMLLINVLLVAMLLFSSVCYSQSNSIEYKIKAGYLYNFTRFITWPENNLETFNLCILGKDPFGSIINPIENRTVKNKPIRLFRLKSISKIKNCHIVYFSRHYKYWRKLNLKLPGTLIIGSQNKTLMVGESKPFITSGGMIAFFQKQDKVKLLINPKALKQVGLEVSAKLLEVAEIYEGDSNE